MNRTEIGDCRTILPIVAKQTFRCCVTSPPYWGLRDYGHADQIGREATPDAYVAALVDVFRQVRRTLLDDGTLWLNLGDSYANDGKWGGSTSGKHAHGLSGKTGVGRGKRETGLKPKDLIGIPWRVALALQADGWYLRSDIIWSKPNPMPESVSDRPTKAHEYVFLLTKSEQYFYDAEAIREPVSGGAHGGARLPSPLSGAKCGMTQTGGKASSRLGQSHVADDRNARSVWSIQPEPYTEAHFATMPTKLAARCIQAGSSLGDTVLDPFMGSGTVGQVAESLGRRWFGCELNPDYGELSAKRTAQTGLQFAAESPES
jgi:DNA modification methylase